MNQPVVVVVFVLFDVIRVDETVFSTEIEYFISWSENTQYYNTCNLHSRWFCCLR